VKNSLSCVIIVVILVGMLTATVQIKSTRASYPDDYVIEKGRSGTLHWGSGVVHESESFNFGTGDIFWSLCYFGCGYFYGSSYSSPDVFFADKIVQGFGSYDMCRGVSNIWEFVNADDHEWFTEHAVFFAAMGTGQYTGIILIHQNGLYGAINPKSVHDNDTFNPGEFVLEFDWWYDDSGASDFSSLRPTTVEVFAQALNLRSMCSSTSCYVDPPEGVNASDMHITSVTLNDTLLINPILCEGVEGYDGLLTLAVDFNRTSIIELMKSNNFTFGNVTLTVAGQVENGTLFEGNTTMRISSLMGDVNCDGKVSLEDLQQLACGYGSKAGDAKWNDNAAFAQPWDSITLTDLVTVAVYYGQSCS
jgi:hypothetical protein